MHGQEIRTMSTIQDILDLFEEFAPQSLQENYDNSGLQVGKPSDEVKSILLSLDVTEDVVKEARERGADLIVAHHPIVFKGLKRLSGANYVERTVELALLEGIGILAQHTNIDNMDQGVNRIIADLLELKNPRILAPKNLEGKTTGIGAGMIGELKDAISEGEFLKIVKSRFKAEAVRHSPLLGKKVRSIAICGGAGSFLLPLAKEAGADAYLSGDFKYHEFFDADGKILITDPGHYETEQFTVRLFKKVISEKFANIALHFSEVRTNPIHYYQ